MPEDSAAVLIVSLAAAAIAHGQDASEAPTEAPAAEDLASRFSLDLSVSYTSDYFFRGIVQRSDAFNIQPSAQLSFALLDEEHFSLSVLGGSWSNFSDDLAPGHTGDFSEHWYEHDAYAGVSISAGRFTLDSVYTWYFSPASDFTEVEDITLTLSYEDADHWGDEGRFSLNPWASIAFETRNAASGPDSGTWLGFGVEPSVALGDTVLGPATLSFPVNVGLSLDDYYQSSDGSSTTYGFTQIGTALSFDLADQFGRAAPTLDVGVSYLMLGGVLDDLNGGDADEVVLSAGLSWSF